MKATAVAPPNIALVKYWGKRNTELNLPATSSLSLTLDQFQTQTSVTWGSTRDRFTLNGRERDDQAAAKVFHHLNRIDPNRPPCRVESENNFPTAAGLASSASAFAALTLAATTASGRDWTTTQHSIMARQGSGSACRSFWGGFVIWNKGIQEDGTDSHGQPLAGPKHWDLRLLVAVIDSGPKKIGSTLGMTRSATTSPYYESWVNTGEADLSKAIAAVQNKDLKELGQTMELSMNKMHGVMITTTPSIRYLQPQSNAVLRGVVALRAQGIVCYATMDAGPNVKVLCRPKDTNLIQEMLMPHCERVYSLNPGEGAKLV